MVKFLLGIYIGAWTAYAISVIGQPYTTSDGRYDWRLPINIFCLLVIPALLGYWIGRKNR